MCMPLSKLLICLHCPRHYHHFGQHVCFQDPQFGGLLYVSIFKEIDSIYNRLDMHPLAAASRSRLLETVPRLFVFETSYYAFYVDK